MPGRGLVVGKWRAWRAACLERKRGRGMGSWAQAWKISEAWGVGVRLRKMLD